METINVKMNLIGIPFLPIVFILFILILVKGQGKVIRWTIILFAICGISMFMWFVFGNLIKSSQEYEIENLMFEYSKMTSEQISDSLTIEKANKMGNKIAMFAMGLIYITSTISLIILFSKTIRNWTNNK